eukprot:9175580-Alexandrium_andersonii.AAC.1
MHSERSTALQGRGLMFRTCGRARLLATCRGSRRVAPSRVSGKVGARDRARCAHERAARKGNRETRIQRIHGS